MVAVLQSRVDSTQLKRSRCGLLLFLVVFSCPSNKLIQKSSGVKYISALSLEPIIVTINRKCQEF